jgi:hypothetical protein
MLHPTKLPDCAATLYLILDLQDHLLDFARSFMWGSADDFRTGLTAQLGQGIADWLYANRARFIDPLLGFSKRPQPVKDTILQAFRHDRQYPTGAENPAFTFELVVDNTDKAKGEIRAWLVNFYEQFKQSGFPPCIGGGVTDFRDEDWVVAYRRVNQHSKTCTCAVCDGTLKDGTTIEHFFPKSKYPALSVHPYNLLPLCKECNNVYKGDKDPLDGRAMTDIFLPYLRHVREVACLTFKPQPNAQEQIAFEAAPPNNVTTTQLQALADLFKVPQQWQKNIDEICERAIRRARARIESAREDGRTVDETTFPALIDSAGNMMEKDWGREHYSYPSTEWLRWAKVNKFDLLSTELLTS